MKTANKNPKKGRKLKITVGCIALLVLVVIGVSTYQQQQNDKAIAAERAQYDQAEKDLDALAAQIVAKFGQPDDSKKVKSCGYTSDTFELDPRGDLFCSYDIQLIYPVESRDGALTLTANTTDVLTSNKTFVSFEELSASSNSITPEKLSSVGFKDGGGLKCTSSKVYFTKSDDLEAVGYEKLELVNASKGLLIELNCGSKFAKAQYYQLET